ncbi:DUF4328 domain-containing protein [Streptomyces yaanensis]|uniref:DUF4328 domain-containing protein n=1 Tax=Streptomyces yaanensis TaxID=1142239 RepID=A0ABV7SN57_9ACTN|nr:DUF4328 domain-containing protein [Streptomyces sp. CGMCC 4.7035]WNB97357.1 DUF4328 domain-containing protein [Streptomyces sp. CGMCC 4.7035]
MTCARCHHFVAAPGGTLCTQCAAAPAPAAPPFAAVPSAWLRSPVGLGRAAAALLGLVIATDLFAIWADTVVYDVMSDVVGGAVGDAMSRRADRADTLYTAAGIVQTTALLSSVIVFLCWFHRARVNAEVFNPFGHAKKRGWAIGSWFTPVVNLWLPRRITLDIWDASSPSGAPRPHVLVNAWWTLWIISLLTDRVGFSAYGKADTATEIRDAVRQVMFADVVDIAAAALAILVVLRLTRMQHEKALQGPTPVAVEV